ncbi:NUDIX domain-containing protein [Candidatus Thorarchaeota archaeon]|nr:MAG: NUDIX domain-containing protein [Candidatus Thorarchaeota archaeon]
MIDDDVLTMDERRYPQQPIPGVVAIVVSSKGVLLARRDKAPGTGLWSLPGGAVELGETQKESVIREVLEETGVQCEVIKLVSTADLITLDESNSVEFHFLLNHYLARSINGVLKPEFTDGEVGWFHPDKLPEDMVNDEIVNLINSVKDSITELMDE